MADAEQVANRALDHATDPDLLVDLHWTLAQCRMMRSAGPPNRLPPWTWRSRHPGSRPGTVPGC